MFRLIQNFDVASVNWLNHLTPRPNFFTSLMVLIWDNDLLKGAVLVTLMWFLWFSNKQKQPETRQKIILTIIACFIAIIAGRALAFLLPQRPRPIINPNVHLTTHVELGISNWNSFPSDHAVMFFSLATGLYLISRKIGIFSFVYCLVVIFFPRIYLGLHYPTDIITGAGLGIVITWLVFSQKKMDMIGKRMMNFATKYPGIFYALFFLLTFQIATLFDESRIIGSYFLRNFMKLISMVMT